MESLSSTNCFIMKFNIVHIYFLFLSLSLSLAATTRKPVIPADIKKEVDKNFNYLVSLIHRDMEWMSKILSHIKRELSMRKKAKDLKTECDWCLIDFDSNGAIKHAIQMSKHSTERDKMSEDSMDTKKGPMNIPRNKIRLKRSPVGGTSFHMRRNVSNANMNETEKIQVSDKQRNVINENDDYFEEPIKEDSPNEMMSTEKSSLLTGTTKYSSDNSIASLEDSKPVAQESKSPFPEKDNKGKPIMLCDATEKHFCLHKGTCLNVKILELKACKCKVGFAGRRCEMYDVIKTVDILSEIKTRRFKTVQELKSYEQWQLIESALKATSIYTVNTFMQNSNLYHRH